MSTDVTTDLSTILSSNYMLASLTVRAWSARLTDREATADLLAQKGATSNAASVVKSLLAGNDRELKDTQAAYNRLRTWFYANSLPWTTDEGQQRGDRLVGTAQAMTFLRDFARIKTEAEIARDLFLSVYDAAVTNSAANLGTLYDVTQYPPKESVRKLFGASLDVTPMPDIGDFDRVSIPGIMATGLKGQFEKLATRRVECAITDAQERIVAELNRMALQLGKVATGEPTRLYKTLITNMETVVGLAKSLGPLSPELTKVAEEIEDKLLRNDIEAYKDNAALARRAAEDAISIVQTMAPTTVVTAPAVPYSLNKVEPEEFTFDENSVFDLGD